MFSKKSLGILFLVLATVGLLQQCHQTASVEVAEYWNHSDSVEYVGIQKCASCHGAIYQSFMETGMGQSLDGASPHKSKISVNHPPLFDEVSNLHYRPYWKNDSLFVQEFRLEGRDTVHNLHFRADYVIGSGQHTNSHLMEVNGYVFQMPFTWYTQEGRLDFPPGFENGNNSRFERKIGLECMSCHNAMPTSFVAGSENKYTEIPRGIDCERCHGPGGAHVRKIMAGNITDTAKNIDYSIVNPKKLPTQLQFELCSRCHLQGNAVLDSGKSFFDFKPGMHLHEVMDVDLPRYSDSEDQFIMASHVDRFKMSKCFEAGKGQFVCTSCHNPHVSVKKTGVSSFNKTCQNCHGGKAQIDCSAPQSERLAQQDNCSGCHMPSSGSIDIPHVTVHDHYIRKPKAIKEQTALRKFLGLVAVNNPQPSQRSRIRAYIQQYEKFGSEAFMLDSAAALLKKASPQEFLEERINLWHLQNNAAAIIALVDQIGPEKFLAAHCQKKSWDNVDAWTAYRVGQAYAASNRSTAAGRFYKQAVDLAPYQLEFAQKWGVWLVGQGQWLDAEAVFVKILQENPFHAEARGNLGYVAMRLGQFEKAEKNYQRALQLRPDYERAQLNYAALLFQMQEKQQARKLLEKVLKKNPLNLEARQALQMI